MLRHVTSFRWIDESTPEQRAAAIARIRKLPSVVPEIRSLELGEDLGLRPDSPHVLMILDFDDQEGFQAYEDSPDHRAISATIRPLVERSAKVEYLR